VLIIAALATLTYATIEAGRVGFGATRIVILLAVALGCLVRLVSYELRRDEPLLEMRFFTSAPFAGAAAIALCLSVALGGFLFVSTLYLQDVRGLSALRAGLCMLPTAAAIIVFALISGRLTGRFGARPSMVGGGLLVMASGLMLTALSRNLSVPYLLGAYAVFGVGFALTSPPIANTAVAGMPPAQAGMASAVATTSRQVGVTFGVAVLGTIVGAGLNTEITPAFAHATHPGWWIIAGLGLTVAALGWLTTRPGHTTPHDAPPNSSRSLARHLGNPPHRETRSPRTRQHRPAPRHSRDSPPCRPGRGRDRRPLSDTREVSEDDTDGHRPIRWRGVGRAGAVRRRGIIGETSSPARKSPTIRVSSPACSCSSKWDAFGIIASAAFGNAS
jgi:hypothetical protein